jgi:hypothetical protein
LLESDEGLKVHQMDECQGVVLLEVVCGHVGDLQAEAVLSGLPYNQ